MKKSHGLNKKFVKILILILIILSVLFIVFLGIQFGLIDLYNKIFRETKLYVIPDQCSLILNQLIHQIRDKDDCQIRCFNHCKLIDSTYKSSELIYGNMTCHTCNCYCK